MLFILSIPFRDAITFKSEGIPLNLTFVFGVLLMIAYIYSIAKGILKVNKTIFVPLTLLLITQIFLSIISYVNGHDIDFSRFFSFLQYYLLITIISTLVCNVTDLKRIFFFLFLSTFILSCFTVINFLMNKEEALSLGVYQFRAFGGFRNPSYLGLYLLTTLPILIFFLRSSTGIKKFFVSIGIFLALSSLILSFMRSAYLVLIIQFIYFIIINIKYSILKSFLYLLALPIVLIIAFYVMQALGIDVLLLQRFQHIQNLFNGNDHSYELRSTVMKGAWEIFLKNFLLGVGPGNLPKELYVEGYTTYVRSAENTYLHIICEYGAIIILALGTLIYYLNKKYNRYSSNNIFIDTLKLSFLGILLISMFDNNQGELIIYIIIGIRYSNFFRTSKYLSQF